MFLGEELADTEHVLLGLVRVAHEHHDCGFARIVGVYDRLRIRNEVLRLVARPPDPAEVARRKAKASAPPGESKPTPSNCSATRSSRYPPATRQR